MTKKGHQKFRAFNKIFRPPKLDARPPSYGLDLGLQVGRLLVPSRKIALAAPLGDRRAYRICCTSFHG